MQRPILHATIATAMFAIVFANSGTDATAAVPQVTLQVGIPYGATTIQFPADVPVGDTVVAGFIVTLTDAGGNTFTSPVKSKNADGTVEFEDALECAEGDECDFSVDITVDFSQPEGLEAGISVEAAGEEPATVDFSEPEVLEADIPVEAAGEEPAAVDFSEPEVFADEFGNPVGIQADVSVEAAGDWSYGGDAAVQAAADAAAAAEKAATLATLVKDAFAEGNYEVVGSSGKTGNRVAASLAKASKVNKGGGKSKSNERSNEKSKGKSKKGKGGVSAKSVAGKTTAQKEMWAGGIVGVVCVAAVVALAAQKFSSDMTGERSMLREKLIKEMEPAVFAAPALSSSPLMEQI